MPKRQMPQDITMTGDYTPPLKDGTAQVGPAAVGHAGHVIRIHADYAIFCETDGVFLNADALASGKKPGI